MLRLVYAEALKAGRHAGSVMGSEGTLKVFVVFVMLSFCWGGTADGVVSALLMSLESVVAGGLDCF